MKPDSKIDSIVRGILDYLETKKSLDLLPQVIEGLTKQGLNRVDPNLAVIYSPVKLEADQLKEIKDILTKKFGRNITVKARVDKSIIAGFVIELGGQVIDASVNKELKDVKEEMLYD